MRTWKILELLKQWENVEFDGQVVIRFDWPSHGMRGETISLCQEDKDELMKIILGFVV